MPTRELNNNEQPGLRRYVKFHTGKAGHKTALFSSRSHGSGNGCATKWRQSPTRRSKVSGSSLLRSPAQHYAVSHGAMPCCAALHEAAPWDAALHHTALQRGALRSTVQLRTAPCCTTPLYCITQCLTASRCTAPESTPCRRLLLAVDLRHPQIPGGQRLRGHRRGTPSKARTTGSSDSNQHCPSHKQSGRHSPRW